MVKILQFWFNFAPLRGFIRGTDVHSRCVYFYPRASATVLAQQGGALKSWILHLRRNTPLKPLPCNGLASRMPFNLRLKTNQPSCTPSSFCG